MSKSYTSRGKLFFAAPFWGPGRGTIFNENCGKDWDILMVRKTSGEAGAVGVSPWAGGFTKDPPGGCKIGKSRQICNLAGGQGVQKGNWRAGAGGEVPENQCRKVSA
jgi:hypothetical protein